MNVPKCKLTKDKIKQHAPRRGEAMVTDAAASGGMRVAIFKPGCRALCKCQAGMCDEADCDELGVFDDQDEQLCSFGPEFRAANEAATESAPISGLVIYKMPHSRQRTQDANERGVRAINRRNADFWAVRDPTEASQ
jgi:hypothetical protein